MTIDKKLLIKLPEALVEKNDFGEQSLFFPIPVCLRNKNFRNTSGCFQNKTVNTQFCNPSDTRFRYLHAIKLALIPKLFHFFNVSRELALGAVLIKFFSKFPKASEKNHSAGDRFA